MTKEINDSLPTITNKLPMFFTICSILFTGLVALTVGLIRGILNDVKKSNILSATLVSKMDDILSRLIDLKEEVKEIGSIKLQLSDLQSSAKYHKENTDDLKKRLEHAEEHIHNVKDDIKYIYKDLNSK